MRVHDNWLEQQGKETALGSSVFNTLVPGRVELPYLLFYPRDGVDRSTRLAGPAAELNPSWLVYGVGSTADDAKWAIEQLKKRLIVNGFGVVPEIEGENPGRVWFESTEPVQVDRDVTPPLCFQVAECGFSSDLL
jgi:hypothetical protein